MLVAKGNLASTYKELGRLEESMSLRQEVYSGHLKLNGEEHSETLREANNYASLLLRRERYGEASNFLRKLTSVARRVLGESHDLTLRMRHCYAKALYMDPAAALDNLREAVATLEEIEPIARRVFGGAHPTAVAIADSLRRAQAVLRTRETPSGSA